MAKKLGIFNQLFFDKWADRSAINANAEALESVEMDVTALRKVVARQAKEIDHLHALIEGVVEVLHAKLPFDDAELEHAVTAALERRAPPQPAPQPTDPYRNTPAGSTPDDPAAAALLRAAQDHHFAKRFAEARAAYKEIVERHAESKQAKIAQQQIENLRGS
jgi:hypothetical protein